MDGRRLAAHASRRGLLGRLAAALAGAGAAAGPAAAACGRPGAACGRGRRCCPGARCEGGVCACKHLRMDCGGACRRCCAGADCPSGVCRKGACQAATCADGVRNGAETDADCGGPKCPPCGDGARCGGDADCESGACVGGRCGCRAGLAACEQDGECCSGRCLQHCRPPEGDPVPCGGDADCPQVVAGRPGTCVGDRCLECEGHCFCTPGAYACATDDQCCSGRCRPGRFDNLVCACAAGQEPCERDGDCCSYGPGACREGRCACTPEGGSCAPPPYVPYSGCCPGLRCTKRFKPDFSGWVATCEPCYPGSECSPFQ